MLRIFVGCFLLGAAVLKAFGGENDVAGNVALLQSGQFRLGLIEAESALGLCLVAGIFPTGIWLITTVFFAAGAGYNLYLTFSGQMSCGCLGQASIHPRYVFVLDLLILAALAWFRPRFSQTVPAGMRIAGVAFFSAVLPGLVLLLTYGGLCRAFPAVPAKLAAWKGESVTIDPLTVDAGEGKAGELREVFIRLTNHLDRPIEIQGGTSDCRCTVIPELPVAIAAGESREIPLQIKFSGASGRFRHGYVLFTDDPGQRTATGYFHGMVRSDDP